MHHEKAVCVCPHCNSADSVPILWGYPSERGMEAGRQGLIAFGGCMIDNAHLNRQCRACRHRWEEANPPAFDWSSVKPVPVARALALWRRIWAYWTATS